jgi:dTDP-6-deoxy-L-talose 4-dehydrogenase (NAD+)
MKVAVTGGTGFLGRHVISELERRAVSILLICRPSTVIPSTMARHSAVRINLDEAGPDIFELIGQPDALIHLAWSGLPNYNSLHHFETELPRQYQFLKTLVQSGIMNLLVSGTCFEYGNQSGPLSEDLETRPENPYGFAKDTLRRQLGFLQKTKQFNLTWARLFYLYGDGQNEKSLFPQLKKTVEMGSPVFNMSGGEQLRDYLPVTTAAQHLAELAIRRDNHGVVNICSGQPISVRKVIELWIAENQWSIELNPGYYPYPDYEPMAFWGTRDKLNRCLGLPE